jgi:hypothetical protein
MRRPVPTTVLAAALAVSALAGCSAGVKHAAVRTGTSSTTTSTVKGHRATTTTTTTKASATTVSAGGGASGGGSNGGGGSSGGGTSGGGGTATTKPGATTTTLGGPADITSFVVSTAPTCADGFDHSNVTVSWTSKGASEAWLLPGSVASSLVGADARTTTPNIGPVSANGSSTLPFDCGNAYNYVLLDVYGGSTHSGQVLQLPNNIDPSVAVN